MRNVYSSRQMLFQCLAFYKVHNEIPVSTIEKMVVNPRKVGVYQAAEDECFPLEGISSCIDLPLTQAALSHFLHGHQPIAKFAIFCLIDCTKAALTHLLDD